MYVCYLLKGVGTAHTYIGITNNLTRRLRQHNGELVGGAKRTRGRQWELAAHVAGCSSRREVLMLEWAWQKRRDIGSRAGGVMPKLQRLCALTQKERWTSAAPLAAQRPLTITLFNTLCTLIPAVRALRWPAHVVLVTEDTEDTEEPSPQRRQLLPSPPQ